MTTAHNMLTGIDLHYNPVVPIRLGHIYFSGPQTTQLQVQALTDKITEIDDLLHEHYYFDKTSDIQFAQYILEEQFNEARAQLVPLCSPAQLQYVDTLIYLVTKPPPGPCASYETEHQLMEY